MNKNESQVNIRKLDLCIGTETILSKYNKLHKWLNNAHENLNQMSIAINSL